MSLYDDMREPLVERLAVWYESPLRGPIEWEQLTADQLLFILAGGRHHYHVEVCGIAYDDGDICEHDLAFLEVARRLKAM